MSAAYAVGATVQYDPSGARDPNGQHAGVTRVIEQPDGSHLYSLVLRDRHTARPILPAINNVAETSVYRTPPQPGPGNDL